MAIFKLQDGTQFYQWDKKRKLIVTDDRIDEAHFTNSTLDKAIVQNVYEADGIRLVDVPAYLLECDCNMTVYAYIQQEDKEYTLVHEIFGVMPRKKPDDYVEEEEQAKWSDLDARITALEQNGGGGSLAGGTVDGNLKVTGDLSAVKDFTVGYTTESDDDVNHAIIFSGNMPENDMGWLAIFGDTALIARGSEEGKLHIYNMRGINISGGNDGVFIYAPILESEGHKRFKLLVDDDGNLTTSAV